MPGVNPPFNPDPSTTTESAPALKVVNSGSWMYFYKSTSRDDGSPLMWLETDYDGKSNILSIPDHRHFQHTEIMTVMHGRMQFKLNGVAKTYGPEDGDIIISEGVIHSFSALKGVPVRFRERTIPGGYFKREFFRDLFGESGSPGFLHAFRAFTDGDTFVTLPGGFAWVDWAVTSAIGEFAKLVLPSRPLPASTPETERKALQKEK